MKFPTVSIIIPTLNSQRTLFECLESIKIQDYKGKIETLILDGGSTDNTIQIATKFGGKIYINKLQTAEAGKAIGVKRSSGAILAFIDSDNILENSNWLTSLVRPFIENGKVVATEPIFFTHRKKDHWLTRYFSLLGMGDPLNLFIGNYDRYSYVSNKWTGLKLKEKNKSYGKEILLDDKIPTIGANGFLIKKTELEKFKFGKYLFDIDAIKYLSKKCPITVVKVKTGVIHLFSGNVSTFIRKQKRRARDYFYHKKKGDRLIDDQSLIFFGVAKFILATVFIFPLLFQTLVGYMRKKDVAWLFHPVACQITLFIYAAETIRSFFVAQEYSRRNWSQ